MGGIAETLQAPTMSELEKKAREWEQRIDITELEIREGWTPERARETDDGSWEIRMSAHT